MSTSPSSPDSSSGPRRKRRRRRGGPGGQGQGQPQGQHRPQGHAQGQSHSNHGNSGRGPRPERPEGAGEGRTRRRYNKPAAKPETTFEKIIRFLTFGIVDSRQKPQTRVPERVPVPTPENRRERDRDRSERPERPARTANESSSAPKSRDRDREGAERRDREPRAERPARREENRERKPPEPVEPTTERLHVGNLDYDCTEADLYDLFNGVGSVRDAEIVYHKYTQRSKGFAFVVMASVDEAKRAFQLLNGKEFMGRPMWVNGAKSAGPAESEASEEAEAASTSA